MKEIIPILVELVFTVVSVVILPMVYKWLKEKLTAEQLTTLETIVKWAVYGIEQIIKESGAGSIKKEQVIQIVTDYCEKHGIKLDSELLDVLIESIVKEMNDRKILIEGE